MLSKPYYLSLIIISASASMALFSFWRYILLHAPVKGKKDLGLAYLSGAMSVWAIVGLWGFIAPYSPYLFSDCVFSLLSTVNSVLYLLAIQHFDYAPEQIRRRWWKPTVITFAILVVLGTVLLSWYSFVNGFSRDDARELLNWPDVLFSFPTIFAISVGFWRSFYYRGYKLLAWLSTIAMILVLLVQLPDVLQWLKIYLGEVEQWLTISSYALLMMFCFALAASWGVEEFSLPLPNQIFLTFDNKDKRWQMQLRIREQQFTALLSPMTFKNLLFFVAQRIKTSNAGWVNVGKDLNGGHVDLRRILLPIAQAWHKTYPSFEEDMKEYMEKTRRTLFEYQNPGKYRLKVAISNLEFTDALFSTQDELVAAMPSRAERDDVLDIFKSLQTREISKENIGRQDIEEANNMSD